MTSRPLNDAHLPSRSIMAMAIVPNTGASETPIISDDGAWHDVDARLAVTITAPPSGAAFAQIQIDADRGLAFRIATDADIVSQMAAHREGSTARFLLPIGGLTPGASYALRLQVQVFDINGGAGIYFGQTDATPVNTMAPAVLFVEAV